MNIARIVKNLRELIISLEEPVTKDQYIAIYGLIGGILGEQAAQEFADNINSTISLIGNDAYYFDKGCAANFAEFLLNQCVSSNVMQK